MVMKVRRKLTTKVTKETKETKEFEGNEWCSGSVDIMHSLSTHVG